MERSRKYAGWDKLVRDHLTARAADNPGFAAYVLDLWRHYLDSGLAHDHFVRELTKGDNAAFFARIWEMMLGRHLCSCGYGVISPSQEGWPDFRCEKQGRVMWVEATCIAEGDDQSLAPIADWRCSSGYVPHDNILIRWTNSIRTKIEQANTCRSAGVVSSGESYIIAINGGAIAVGNYGFGSSQLPYAVEATLGIGSLQFVYDRETLVFKMAEHKPRTHVRKHNGADVPTTVFYDPKNAAISAVVGCGSFWTEQASLELLVAHNPYAKCPVPLGHLGCDNREWAAKFKEQDSHASCWEVEQVFGNKLR